MSSSKCRKYSGFYPNIKPIVYSFSTYTSVKNVYTLVNIVGENFFPNGTTAVNFGPYTNLPVIYNGSFNISFVVPSFSSSTSVPITYDVYVTTTTNSNFNPFLLYSTPTSYTIT
jgi:hypothetical protein